MLVEGQFAFSNIFGASNRCQQTLNYASSYIITIQIVVKITKIRKYLLKQLATIEDIQHFHSIPLFKMGYSNQRNFIKYILPFICRNYYYQFNFYFQKHLTFYLYKYENGLLCFAQAASFSVLKMQYIKCNVIAIERTTPLKHAPTQTI